MSFLNNEYSGYGGKPVQLYEFWRSSGGTEFLWAYNGSDRDITYGGALYKAVSISDAGARFSNEAVSTDLIVTMPIIEDFPQTFRLQGSIPSDSVLIRVRRAHGDDIANIDTAPVAAEAPLVWIGTVSGVKQTDEVTAEVTCSMLTASLRRDGLRYGYQIPCPHVLYAPTTCKVDKSLYLATCTVTSLAGLRIGSTEFGLFETNWFNGGFIEYTTAEGFTERRGVTGNSGIYATVMGFPAGLEVGGVLSAFPGCNHATTHCIDKFNNLLNYGGFIHTPRRNPFDGMPVF